MAEKLVFCWSGGKDSALALSKLRQDPAYEVVALLTTVTEGFDRISMHGVRTALLEQQAASVGLPLEKVYISRQASNQEYESRMRDALQKFKRQGVSAVAFGDIFLEDLRKYREENLAREGLRGVFPLWKCDTTELARHFISSSFRTVICCVDTQVLSQSFAGREFDERFLADLPAGVDPCGENGEFHSFAYAGPCFRKPVAFTRGEVVLRDNRFCYCDLVP